MSRKFPRTRKACEGNAEGEMTFAEIGRAMGISKAHAWMLYLSAISKIRKRHPEAVERLRKLANSKGEAF